MQAQYTPSNKLSLVQTKPHCVTLQQLRSLLGFANLPATGTFELGGNIPVGAGAGASTAALVALARAAGVADAALPEVCLRVERATDPLMLTTPDSVVWSSRAAQVIDVLKPPPLAEIVGGFLGEPIRTDAGDSNFADISDLLPQWARAAEAADLGQAAMLAGEAARRTTQLRGPFGDPTAALADRLGALGYARAHTGSARALIFAPGTVPSDAQAQLEKSGVSNVLQFRTGGGA